MPRSTPDAYEYGVRWTYKNGKVVEQVQPSKSDAQRTLTEYRDSPTENWHDEIKEGEIIYRQIGEWFPRKGFEGMY
jgi:hypothetical protein